jgi:hypothetical protein
MDQRHDSNARIATQLLRDRSQPPEITVLIICGDPSLDAQLQELVLMPYPQLSDSIVITIERP